MTANFDLRVLVVGTGLIGTSVALAARAAGAEVALADRDHARLSLATSLGAGSEWTGDPVDLAVVAVPPAGVGAVAADLLGRDIAGTVTHVSSVQSLPQLEVEAQGVRIDRFVGGHPIAGREVSGPIHASDSLFRDRPWVLCPTSTTAADALEAAESLARACGAVPVVRSAAEHDRILARLSHAPQLAASAIAASMTELDPADIALAGTGIRDTTRLADSDPTLWSQIVAANAGSVAAALRAVAEPLLAVAAALEGDGRSDRAGELLEAGRRGRALLPGKHGRPATPRAVVEVVVPDRPGALAALLAAVAAEAVNLEDLRVDHAPGQAVGVADLVVAVDRRDALAAALRAAGWEVSAGPSEAL